MSTTELTRWVSLSPQPGADIVAALRAVATSIGSTAYIDGAGEVSDPAVMVRTEDGSRLERRYSGPWDLLSLRGHVTAGGEAMLYALLARASGAGQELVGGLLVSGVVMAASIRASITAQPRPQPASYPVAVPPPAASPRPADVGVPPPAASPAGSLGAPAIPRRPPREYGPDIYPEEGDVVTHFAFGRCTVVMSDGERIRLQQERDGRVREVALSMLKLEDHTMLPDGKRHWQLARKN